MKKTGINSNEIARLAGVSRSTVSRVINNYPNVPEATREKVLQVIGKYGYVPNLSAQIMVGKKTRTIGLFMISPDLVSTDMLSNLLITRVIESASLRGHYVLTHIIRHTQDPEEHRMVKDSFHQKRIDGGIFIGAANYEPLVEELIKEGHIVGIVDQHLPGRLEPNRIVSNFDNRNGISEGVEYLVQLGHRDIAFISGDPLRLSGPEKYEAFVAVMAAHGLSVHPEWIVPGDFSEESGYAATAQWLMQVRKLPTAIFAVNDSVAFGALRALSEKGLRVPEDISLLGFDDHLLSSRIVPALSTIHVDFSGMMDELTEAVIHGIQETPVQPVALLAGTSLVIRDSCRKV
ncbi:LacI family transcriptional regulator [Fontibacillus phaseoli]|uniref:LacI family transcriptional regulator n=1 Tax=Fontibacillus phaseoli TaxID=1416533 RepID=A0A369BLX2_9BACL|nr:LacI family DNA-binding transcriptional regulator [Fontibacillus phaseoli]RCX20694.1 LacI family transcriptional regulator [Fontibacillus phaseoli]